MVWYSIVVFPPHHLVRARQRMLGQVLFEQRRHFAASLSRGKNAAAAFSSEARCMQQQKRCHRRLPPVPIHTCQVHTQRKPGTEHKQLVLCSCRRRAPLAAALFCLSLLLCFCPVSTKQGPSSGNFQARSCSSFFFFFFSCLASFCSAQLALHTYCSFMPVALDPLSKAHPPYFFSSLLDRRRQGQTSFRGMSSVGFAVPKKKQKKTAMTTMTTTYTDTAQKSQNKNSAIRRSDPKGQ